MLQCKSHVAITSITDVCLNIALMERNIMLKNLYQDVTDELMFLMKGNTIPWRKTWGGAVLMPRNGHSGRLYQGINVPFLWCMALRNKFSSNEWFTYGGAIQAGGNVAKGQRSKAMAIYWKIIEKKKEQLKPNDIKHTFPIIRSYCLFNRDQIENLPNDPEPSSETCPPEYGMAGDCVGELAPEIREGKPSYVVDFDVIQMPKESAFDTEADYYSTMFHELAHWTGHKNRLNRFGPVADADEDKKDVYAFEELVAELASCYCCAWFDIQGGMSQATSYIKHWNKAMGADSKYIFKASRLGFEAAKYILGYPPELESNAVEARPESA